MACLVVPTLLRKLITGLRLDRYDCWLAPLVRFHDAPWYYLLTGADFKKKDLPDYIRITAIVDIAGMPYLYQGMLDDFYFAADGQLDRLVLEQVSRRLLSRDKSAASLPGEIAPAQNAEAQPVGAAERFYPIDGDSFVLRMSEAVTLNVVYIKLDEGGAAHPPPPGTTDEEGAEPNESA